MQRSSRCLDQSIPFPRHLPGCIGAEATCSPAPKLPLGQHPPGPVCSPTSGMGCWKHALLWVAMANSV